MNPKYFTLEWWSLSLWFIIFGLWSVIAVSSLLSALNGVIVIGGLILMVYCATQEETWFPSSEVNSE